MNMFTKLFAVSAIACMATAVQAQEVTTPPTFNIDPALVMGKSWRRMASSWW